MQMSGGLTPRKQYQIFVVWAFVTHATAFLANTRMRQSHILTYNQLTLKLSLSLLSPSLP